MKRIFAIEWPDDFGELWMGVSSLRSCMFSSIHADPNTASQIRIEDVTKKISEFWELHKIKGEQSSIEELKYNLQLAHDKINAIIHHLDTGQAIRTIFDKE